MAKAGRVILAVLAGAAVWAALWNAGTRAAQAGFPDILVPGAPVTHAGMLVAYVALSVTLSVLAGFVTGLVAGGDPMRAVWILAALQLALGIGFEVSYWGLLPVWYHLVFLVLIVPATVFGGKLRARRRVVSMHSAEE